MSESPDTIRINCTWTNCATKGPRTHVVLARHPITLNVQCTVCRQAREVFAETPQS